MRDIYRTYYHTTVNCQVADLKTGRLKDIDYEMKSKYTDQKILEYKLAEKLKEDEKRLIKIYNFAIFSVTYYQKESTFKEHADYRHICRVNVADNKETKNKNKKERKTKTWVIQHSQQKLLKVAQS